MSAAILQVSSSNALALKSETMVNDNINNSNNNNNSIADYSSALKQQMQLLMGEKNNKLSASTNSSHASSALNMFQENDEEIINDNDMEGSEEFDYDNYSYSETAEGLGIRLNNNDDDNIHLKDVDKKENGEEEFEEEDDEYGNVNEGENGYSNKSVNDRDDKINKDQDCGTLDDNNKNNEKSKKNQIPHFEYVSYDKVQDLYEQRKGHFYFIPEGFEPVLVPNDTKAQTVTNLLESTKPVSAAPNVSRMLPDTDVRLPSYALPCGVNASSKKENANKTNSKPKKTPRPPNAFILYRRAKQPLIVAKNAGISNNDVSKEIGKMWHEESLEVRQKYQKLAEKAKEEHMKRFPEYKYRPRRPQDKKRHHSPQPIPVAAPAAAIVHDEKESEEGKMNNVEKKINNEALNINNNIDNSIHDLYYNDDESFYNNCHHQQQYQLLSVPSQQMFYQNQINSISPVDTFSLIGNTTDFISSDVDDNGNNNQFTTYLQNVNDLDFPLLQELQPNYDFDFNGYNL